MAGSDLHHSSLILSGALWKARQFIPPTILNEMILESVIRMPKIPDFLEYWALFEEIYERFIAERELLPDRRAEISELGAARGLKAVREPF